MDRELLRLLRWAYNYLCLPREALMLRKLHEAIDERTESGPLFLDHEEACLVERALTVCRALQDLEHGTSTPLRILDGKGRTSPLLLTDAEIEASVDEGEDEGP